MAPPTKPLILHGTLLGPNPFKVALILRELNLPYTVNPLDFADVKTPAVTSLNPNGRIPALTDPNTGLTIWESGAIIEYLVATYDTRAERKLLSFEPGTADHWHAIQWLHFQMSGQGPYFGQAFWFRNNHPEKVPSALERYENEMRRVCGVLDGWLAGELGAGSGEDGGGRERKYLVGEKCSFADLAFIPWQGYVKGLIDAGTYGEFDEKKEFPHMHAWFERLRGREAVKEVFAEKAAAVKEKAEREAKK
ncbi:glutathione S-transferase [[Emmonsia] crescens]|uniref:Glutathione S-transferase n=1 Tax=[Emmonsia] crescens TaxID=73230 RepID=A0A2B7ZNS4_9EURO|nr:glutathione S-transferase [Emmonsia crescens]